MCDYIPGQVTAFATDEYLRWFALTLPRSEVARSTYDLLPLVGKKLVFPSDRCCAISYVRLLLNDSALKAHRYKTGLVESQVCECGNGTEDSHHFFFECPIYVHPRHILESELQLSWEESCNDGNIGSLYLSLKPKFETLV